MDLIIKSNAHYFSLFQVNLYVFKLTKLSIVFGDVYYLALCWAYSCLFMSFLKKSTRKSIERSALDHMGLLVLKPSASRAAV